MLIGHSQGSFILRRLIATHVDPNPAVRKRLLSAILMGGNVIVTAGKASAATSSTSPACRSHPDRLRDRVLDLRPAAAGQQPLRPHRHATRARRARPVHQSGRVSAVAAANSSPSSPAQPFAPRVEIATGNSLLMITQPMPKTVWASISGAYSGRCSSAGGANVLMISPRGGAQNPQAAPTAEWGLHLLDGQVALGDLVGVANAQAGAFAKRRWSRQTRRGPARGEFGLLTPRPPAAASAGTPGPRARSR